MKRILLAVIAALSLMTVPSCNFSEKFIELSVEQANASCPMAAENGLTVTEVRLSGKNVVYVYQCEEGLYDYDVLAERKDALKEAVIAGLRSQSETDKNVKAFLLALQKTQTGLIYQYNVPGAAPVEVQVGYDEL